MSFTISVDKNIIHFNDPGEKTNYVNGENKFCLAEFKKYCAAVNKEHREIALKELNVRRLMYATSVGWAKNSPNSVHWYFKEPKKESGLVA